MLREDEIGGTALQGLQYYGYRIFIAIPPQAACIWIVMFAYKKSKLRESANKRRASINDVNGNNVINIIFTNDISSINDINSINYIISIDVISVINAWQFPLIFMT